MSINRVCISGNLTRSPELRQTQSGTPVLQMGVAVNERRKNPQTGDWEDYPNFIDVTMFGKRAEAVSHYVSKGSKVAIEGRLHYRSWEAKDGSKRSKLEVVADEVEFMSRQEAVDGGSGNNYTTHGQNGPQKAPQDPTGGFYDEDLPFSGAVAV